MLKQGLYTIKLKYFPISFYFELYFYGHQVYFEIPSQGATGNPSGYCRTLLPPRPPPKLASRVS